MSFAPPQRRNRERNGRYRNEDTRCDVCARGIDTQASEYCTDDEVCQGSDGPGFFLCNHPTCCRVQLRVLALPPEARRRIYAAVRESGKQQPGLINTECSNAASEAK